MAPNQTYEDFASGFKAGRLPLGYTRKDAKQVAQGIAQYVDAMKLLKMINLTTTDSK